MAVTTNFSFTLTDFDKIPWHTEEHNNWHEVDALLARYLAVSNVQGVWQNALTVAVDERYIDAESDTIWEVLVAHTTSSTLTFAAERTAQSTYWQSVSVDVSYAGDWAAGESYSVNQFVSDSRRYGVVTVAHTSVTSYNQGVSNGNITTLIDASDLISTSPVASTLSVGSSATVTFSAATGVFTFGIPTGATGATGAAGEDGEIDNVVEDTTPQLGGDLDCNGNDITSASNADVDINPHGTGNVVLKTDLVSIGGGSEVGHISSNSTQDLKLSTNSATNSGTIVITDGANEAITLTPNGTGIVDVQGSMNSSISTTGKAVVFGF